MRKASSGFSADTVMVDVARDPRPGSPTTSATCCAPRARSRRSTRCRCRAGQIEIELQYRIMDALRRHSDVPVAPMIGFERDPSVLGTPFFVMGYVDGQVPVEDPPYTTAGFFLDVAPADRTRMIERGLATLGAGPRRRLARGGPRLAGAGRDDAGARPPARALGGVLPGRAARPGAPARRPRVRVAARRTAAVRARSGCAGAIPRPGNIIWRDATPVCVTDFEAASIAPPELDVGWWLMFDRTMHEGAGVERPDGDPTRDEQLRMYEAASGRVGARRRAGSRSARRRATARSSCG